MAGIVPFAICDLQSNAAKHEPEIAEIN